jgi:hypothetical protein
MNSYTFSRSTIVIFAIVPGAAFIAAASNMPCSANDKEEICLNRVDSPTQLSTSINRLLKGRRVSELDHFVSSPDGTIALAAAWERVRQTIPEANSGERVAPNGEAVSRFFGLVEGRLQFTLPLSWETTVKSVKADAKKEFSFDYPKRLERSQREQLKRQGDLWIVEKNGQVLRVPAEDHLSLVDKAVVLLSTERHMWLYTVGRPFRTDCMPLIERAGK